MNYELRITNYEYWGVMRDTIMNYEYWVLNDKCRLLSSVEKAKRLISRNGEK